MGCARDVEGKCRARAVPFGAGDGVCQQLDYLSLQRCPPYIWLEAQPKLPFLTLAIRIAIPDLLPIALDRVGALTYLGRAVAACSPRVIGHHQVCHFWGAGLHLHLIEPAIRGFRGSWL